MDSSILSRAFIETIFRSARKNVEKDGDLHPVLWMKLAGRKRIAMIALDFGITSESRYRLMSEIGREARLQGVTIIEAVMCMGCYFLSSMAPDAHKFRPREHPLRQEAIAFFGRNAKNTRQTHVVQSLERDKKNKPVWGAYVTKVYNEPVAENHTTGLIDALFE